MRYLLCKDRKIMGPFEPDELLELPGFGEVSLVCPEDRSGLQPNDWQKAGNAPELRSLIRHGEPETAAAPAAQPARRAAEEEYKKVLAALERRIDLLETELSGRAEPPVGHAERAAHHAGPTLKDMHDSVGALHGRLEDLQQSLERTHHVSRTAIADLDSKTQRALRDLVEKLQALQEAPSAPKAAEAASAASVPAIKEAGTVKPAVPTVVASPTPGGLKPGATPAAEEEDDAPARDKLHQRIIDHTASRFGVDELCREMGDYKAALGGVFTALAGCAGVLKGLVGLALEARALHTLLQWNDFIYALPNDKNTLTILAAFVAVGTGFHQIGAANNHAAMLDSHAQLREAAQRE